MTPASIKDSDSAWKYDSQTMPLEAMQRKDFHASPPLASTPGAPVQYESDEERARRLYKSKSAAPVPLKPIKEHAVESSVTGRHSKSRKHNDLSRESEEVRRESYIVFGGSTDSYSASVPKRPRRTVTSAVQISKKLVPINSQQRKRRAARAVSFNDDTSSVDEEGSVASSPRAPQDRQMIKESAVRNQGMMPKNFRKE